MMKSLNLLAALFVVSITGCSPAEDGSAAGNQPATKEPAREITQEEADHLKNASNIIQDSRIGVPPGVSPESVLAALTKEATAKEADYFVIKRDDNGNIIAADLYKK